MRNGGLFSSFCMFLGMAALWAGSAIGQTIDENWPSLPPSPPGFEEFLQSANSPMTSRMSMSSMNMPMPGDGSGGGGSGGNSSNNVPSPAIVYGTNDLWLEITHATNSGTSMTAFFTLHLPPTNQNGIYGLYMSTNLSIPYNWTWVGRNAVNQTNLVATGLPLDAAFFRLGPPNAIRPGFEENVLTANDDNSTGLVDIGFLMNFFGTDRTQLYVNNNGNVSFDTRIRAFTPIPIIQEALRIPTDLIAPFWGDVDTRGDGTWPVTYGTNMVNGHLSFGVDWVNVGYYSRQYDKINTFQLVFVDRSDRASGDYDVEFNYAQLQWDAGDVSGGVDGIWTPGTDYGGCSARAGFATSTNQFELAGSGIGGGAFLDASLTDGTPNPSGLIYTNFNSTVPGRYVFQFHEGSPLTLPPGNPPETQSLLHFQLNQVKGDSL